MYGENCKVFAYPLLGVEVKFSVDLGGGGKKGRQDSEMKQYKSSLAGGGVEGEEVR